MRKKVLIGCDGSSQSEDALALGAVLARVLGAAPIAASIVPYSSFVLSASTADEVVERVSAPILAMAREHLGELDFETRATLNESAAAGLHSLAEDEDAVLVAIGSSHHGAVGRLLLGSTGTSLLSGAPCPIAVAPRGYSGTAKSEIASIAVGFDGSDESRSALEVAVALAAELGARISIIGALKPVHPYYYPTAPIDQSSYLSAAEELLDRSIEEATAIASAAGLRAEGRLVRGVPSRSVAEAAADDDLLVLGSRGYGPLKRTLLGSVSSGVMQHAECPVLLMPRGVGVDHLSLATQGEQSTSA